MEKILRKSTKSSCLLKKCYQINSFLDAYASSFKKIEMRKNLQGSILATGFNQGPSAPQIQKNKIHLTFKDNFEIAKYLNWRLNESYQELKEIENSLYMVEHNEMATISVNKLFSVDSMSNLEQLLTSKDHINYFHSKIEHIYKFIGKLVMNMSKLGLKFGIRLIQRNPVEIINHFQNLELPSIKELFQELCEEISYLEYDLDRLFEQVGNEKKSEGNLILYELAFSFCFVYIVCFNVCKASGYPIWDFASHLGTNISTSLGLVNFNTAAARHYTKT